MPAPRTPRVLVVEDNIVNQKIAVKLLELLGCPCDVAASGPVCLEMHRRNPYGLIFLDIGMPGMDGYETLRRLREWEAESATPPAAVVALTAFTHAEDRARALDAGMRDHLTKPLKREALKRILDAHLS